MFWRFLLSLVVPHRYFPDSKMLGICFFCDSPSGNILQGSSALGTEIWLHIQRWQWSSDTSLNFTWLSTWIQHYVTYNSPSLFISLFGNIFCINLHFHNNYFESSKDSEHIWYVMIFCRLFLFLLLVYFDL